MQEGPRIFHVCVQYSTECFNFNTKPKMTDDSMKKLGNEHMA